VHYRNISRKVVFLAHFDSLMSDISALENSGAILKSTVISWSFFIFFSFCFECFMNVL
jgi:hypothetical protein